MLCKLMLKFVAWFKKKRVDVKEQFEKIFAILSPLVDKEYLTWHVLESFIFDNYRKVLLFRGKNGDFFCSNPHPHINT